MNVLSVWVLWFPGRYTILWRGIRNSSLSWSNVSRAVHSYSWDANFYLFSSTADPVLAELECLFTDETMGPDKSDGPNSQCCSCLLVWNSVKDYWERLYGSVVYSITKLLIGIFLSVASPKSVRAKGRTFTFVVGKFWRLCSVFIIPGMPVWIRRLKVVDWSVIHPYYALTL